MSLNLLLEQPIAFTSNGKVFSLDCVDAVEHIRLNMLDRNNDNALSICTGTWDIQGDGRAGLAVFTPSPDDLLPTNPLGRPGLYKVYPSVYLAEYESINHGFWLPLDTQLYTVVAAP